LSLEVIQLLLALDLSRDRKHSHLKTKELPVTTVQISDDDILNLLRVRGDYPAIAQETLIRKASAEAARHKGIKVSDDELQKAADGFRLANGLQTAESTHQWLRDAGISVEVFEDYLETNLLIQKLKQSLFNETGGTKCLEAEQVQAIVSDHLYAEWLRSKMAG
jgi:hypothetical protein